MSISPTSDNKNKKGYMNLFCTAHKTSSDKYLRGYDKIKWNKEADMGCKGKKKPKGK
jgi:hypothetical protein